MFENGLDRKDAINFRHSTTLNISRTNADICKRQTAFLFFHGILCDTPKISSGKHLIIVELKAMEYFYRVDIA